MTIHAIDPGPVQSARVTLYENGLGVCHNRRGAKVYQHQRASNQSPADRNRGIMATHQSTTPGSVFGRLTILGATDPHVTPNGTRMARVLCRCSCGVEKIIRVSELVREDGKHTVSCGCYRAERNRSQGIPSPIRHGMTRRGWAHYLYSTWKGIKRRCFDSSSRGFHRYGGRGIGMFQGWIDSPDAFARYANTTLGPRPSGCSLDRIDNNGSYVPGNLRWASKKTQVANRCPPAERLRWGTLTGRRT